MMGRMMAQKPWETTILMVDLDEEPSQYMLLLQKYLATTEALLQEIQTITLVKVGHIRITTVVGDRETNQVGCECVRMVVLLAYALHALLIEAQTSVRHTDEIKPYSSDAKHAATISGNQQAFNKLSAGLKKLHVFLHGLLRGLTYLVDKEGTHTREYCDAMETLCIVHEQRAYLASPKLEVRTVGEQMWFRRPLREGESAGFDGRRPRHKGHKGAGAVHAGDCFLTLAADDLALSKARSTGATETECTEPQLPLRGADADSSFDIEAFKIKTEMHESHAFCTTTVHTTVHTTLCTQPVTPNHGRTSTHLSSSIP